MKQILYHQN